MASILPVSLASDSNVVDKQAPVTRVDPFPEFIQYEKLWIVHDRDTELCFLLLPARKPVHSGLRLTSQTHPPVTGFLGELLGSTPDQKRA